MASVTSLGTGSGLDLEGIITKLMTVESQPLTALATKEASYQAKLSAFGSMKSALSALQTATTALTTEATFTGKSASTSDSTVLTASAASEAASGSYSINVTQLAQYHAVRSNTNYAATTDTFNTGTLSISIGSGAAVDITIDSSNNTLAGIRDAINDADAGVTASIINDGTTNRLVLASNTSGSAGAITVAVTDDGSGGTHALSGLASASLVTTQTADDANLTINGIAITRSSNTITDAVDGLTFNLKDTGTSTVSVSKNTSTVTAAVTAFVKAYNEAVAQIKSLTAYDVENEKAATLTGDSTARGILSQLSGMLGATMSGIGGNVSRLSDLGIAIQRDGTLALDSTKLSAALNNDEVDLAAFFGSTESTNKGIAVRFDEMLENIIGTDGLIEGRTDGINTSIENLQDRYERLELRLEAIEKRYRAQFTALDTLIASMNQTSSYLTQQLANLPGAASSSK